VWIATRSTSAPASSRPDRCGSPTSTARRRRPARPRRPSAPTGSACRRRVHQDRRVDPRAGGRAAHRCPRPDRELGLRFETARAAPPPALRAHVQGTATRTKFLSPYPASKLRASSWSATSAVASIGWPGMIGHNWGRSTPSVGSGSRAQTSAAARATTSTSPPADQDRPPDVALVANGRLVLDGEPLRIGGLDRVYGTASARSRPAASSPFAREGGGRLGAGSPLTRRTSSPGCTPTRRAPSTTRSTAPISTEAGGRASRPQYGDVELDGPPRLRMSHDERMGPLQPYPDAELRRAAAGAGR